MPAEVIGVADRKFQGRLQTGSPIEKFAMKPHYYIGLDPYSASTNAAAGPIPRLPDGAGIRAGAPRFGAKAFAAETCGMKGYEPRAVFGRCPAALNVRYQHTNTSAKSPGRRPGKGTPVRHSAANSALGIARFGRIDRGVSDLSTIGIWDCARRSIAPTRTGVQRRVPPISERGRRLFWNAMGHLRIGNCPFGTHRFCRRAGRVTRAPRNATPRLGRPRQLVWHGLCAPSVRVSPPTRSKSAALILQP
jgi:hypothetical protein